MVHIYTVTSDKGTLTDGGKATTFSIMKLSIMTLSIMTLSIMTLSITKLTIMTLSITTLSITIKTRVYAECHLC